MENFFSFDFDISKIIVAVYVQPGTGDATHINRPFHGIAFNCGSPKKYSFKGESEIVLERNEIIYLPKFSDYVVYGGDNPGDCYAINFDVFTEKHFSFERIKPKNPVKILEYFKDAEAEWKSKSPSYALKCKALLYSIIYELQKEKTQYVSGRKAKLIEPALSYIHKNYTNASLSIAYLSRLCSVSEVYFRKVFKETYHTSPLKYINSLKTVRAKELILTGEYSISQTAFLAGFSDESSFSREFKKQTGMSPKEYKAKTSGKLILP